MITVKLYKINITKSYRLDEQGIKFSLTPWGGDNTDYQGYDDGGQDYILPDGFSTGYTQTNEPGIFDPKDRYCRIGSKFGVPTLVSPDDVIMLKKLGN